jgi:hypothetical protein
MKRLLAVPTAPAIFSVASGVASYEDGGVPVGALTVLFLLGLTALTLAGGGLAPRRRPPHMKRKARAKNHPRRERVARHSPVAKPGYPATQATELIAANPVVIPLQEATASFAPIALDLVDARATLATRAERKYILDAMVFERLIGEIVPHYLILEIDGERVFPYESVYFDTPTRTTYRQHLQERRRRFKCRSRLYASSRLCFFEVKLKGGRGETIKRRLELDAEEHGLLTSPAFGFLERELQETYGARPPTPLVPALSTFYRRLTLVGRENSERLTFDFELKFAGNDREYSIQPGRVLLETKSDVGAGNANRAAGGANRALRRLGVRPVQSCSKYCLGVALTHPELRNNPFRPLIRHHFDAAWQDRVPRYYGEAAAPRSVELEPDGDPVAPPLPTWQEGTA